MTSLTHLASPVSIDEKTIIFLRWPEFLQSLSISLYYFTTDKNLKFQGYWKSLLVTKQSSFTIEYGTLCATVHLTSAVFRVSLRVSLTNHYLQLREEPNARTSAITKQFGASQRKPPCTVPIFYSLPIAHMLRVELRINLSLWGNESSQTV